MGTHHQIPLRGPGRTVNQLRRFYGAERERQRRHAAARARAAQAAIATLAGRGAPRLQTQSRAWPIAPAKLRAVKLRSFWSVGFLWNARVAEKSFPPCL